MMLKKWYPTWTANSIYEIDLETLKKEGIKNILCDLDNTIIPYEVPKATNKEKKWIEKVKKDFNFYIVSNNIDKRVSRFASPINIPFLAFARKPIKKKVKMFMKENEINVKESVFIGDLVITDIWVANRLKMKSILVWPINSSISLKRKIDLKARKKIDSKVPKIIKVV